MRTKKRNGRYIPLSDIEKINTAYLDEIQRVKMRLGGVSDKDLINAFYNVLMNAYNSAIEIRMLEREVDYDIKFAQIKERRHNIKPWRRCWLWRLLFQPLTNRAQDIIEERAELDADIVHTAAEKEIEREREKLPLNDGEELSKRELRRKMKAELKAIIKQADNADVKEAFEEPQTVTMQESSDPAQEPPQRQIVMTELPPQVRKARPPRSCRKPSELNQ